MITRYSFAADSTYSEAVIPCDTTVGACTDQGTFVTSATLDSLTLSSSVTGKTTKLSLQVVDADNGVPTSVSNVDTPQSLRVRRGPPTADGLVGDDGDDAGQDAGDSGGTVDAAATPTTGDDAGGDDDSAGAPSGVPLVFDAGPLINAGGPPNKILSFLVQPMEALPSLAGDSATYTHESPVEDQIGTSNCWIYTTTGWSDALSNAATPGTTHAFSEAYISYWNQYEEIVHGGLTLVYNHAEITWGGTWSHATALVLRYGMMNRGAFVSADGHASLQAQTVINASLKSGPLSDPGNRHNPTFVRAQLDAAWGLSDAVKNKLDATFGPDVSHDFQHGATPPADYSIFRAVDVKTEITNGTLSIGHLDADIGAPGPNDENTGAYAWTNIPYQVAHGQGSFAAHRGVLQSIQRVIDSGLPVPIMWYVDDKSEQSDGSFVNAAQGSKASMGGWHDSLIADYTVDGVPGFGTLAAGTPRTAAQKAAALDPNAQVRLLRIKNSWGTGQGLNGYNDLYLSYLNGTVHVCDANGANCSDINPIDHVVLPLGYGD